MYVFQIVKNFEDVFGKTRKLSAWEEELWVLVRNIYQDSRGFLYKCNMAVAKQTAHVI